MRWIDPIHGAEVVADWFDCAIFRPDRRILKLLGRSRPRWHLWRGHIEYRVVGLGITNDGIGKTMDGQANAWPVGWRRKIKRFVGEKEKKPQRAVNHLSRIA